MNERRDAAQREQCQMSAGNVLLYYLWIIDHQGGIANFHYLLDVVEKKARVRVRSPYACVRSQKEMS